MYCKGLLKLITQLTALLLFSATVLAQFGLPPHGIKFYQEMEPRRADENSCAPLSDDRLAFVWSQADFDGIRRIHLQIVSADQQLAFPADPPALSLNQHSDYPMLCAAADGGAFAVWVELREGNRWGIMLQKLTAGGEPSWRAGGIEVVEVASDRLPYLHIYLSSGGNCFLTQSVYHGQSVVVYAFTLEGNSPDGWSQEGLSIDYDDYYEILPDQWGGFWVRTGRDLFNRVRGDRSLVWDQPVRMEPPVEGFVAISMEAGFRCLFTVWSRGVSRPKMVAVYDSSGQRLMVDTLTTTNPEADGLSLICKATTDDRLIALYNHYVVVQIGRNEYEEPIEPPQAILYAPFEDDPFPWGREGNPLVESLELFAEYFRIYEVGENYLIWHWGNVYPLDHDGDHLWDRNPINLPSLDNGHGFGRNPAIYSSNDFAWVYGGWSYQDFAYRINSTGERDPEDAIMPLIPRQRDMQEYILFPTSNSSLDMVWRDEWRGMVGQHIAENGRLSASFAGEVRDSLWVDGNFGDPHSGIIGTQHWVWRWINYWSGWLNVFDADGNTVTSRQVDFDRQDLTYCYYNECPVSNGRDRLVTLYGAPDRILTLFAFDRQGDIQASGGLRRDGNSGYFGFIRYWPGQGWLILYSGNDEWLTSLFNDRLEPVWQNNPIGDVNREESYFKPDQVVFFDTTAVIYRNALPLDIIVLGASSTVLSVDTLYFFNREWRERHGLGSGFLKSAADGGWWLLVVSGGRHIVQRLSPDGERMMGDDGTVVAEGFEGHEQTSIDLLPDAEGGVWFVWLQEGIVRVTHLNSEGDPQDERYPEEGLNVFRYDNMRWCKAEIDPNTGRVWVIATKDDRVDNKPVSREKRVQLLGDDLTGVRVDKNNAVESFELGDCYPSPFNQITMISFSLPDEAAATLRIYDLGGRLVQDLTPNGRIRPGRHRVAWNAGALAAGLYFVRLESGGRSVVKRAVLLK
ncbi:MAG: T9SS type A sorting domain-containing protein [Candidatus Hatepunaea meridiana]|nr:T9SS type A sorting domain-containing protein [Candidatus Hatepunaea meridiana]